MGDLISTVELVETAVIPTEPDPTHEYVAGVMFSLNGYGESCVAIADATSKTLIGIHRLAKFNDVPIEDMWVSDLLRKWNVKRWRFGKEHQHEESFERHIPKMTPFGLVWTKERITYDRHAQEIQQISGIGSAFGESVDNRRYDSAWVHSVHSVVGLIRHELIHVADRDFAAALCGIEWEERSSGYRLRFPDGKQKLLEAGLLACIEMNHQTFTATDYP